jgi:hypothetical protein
MNNSEKKFLQRDSATPSIFPEVGGFSITHYHDPPLLIEPFYFEEIVPNRGISVHPL